MHQSDETIFELRGIAVEAVVLAVDDTGQAQTVDVQTHDGVVRTGIEVRQIFGIASAPPIAGATCILLAIGGDFGHLVALPCTNPSTRFGNLVAGDGGCVYAQDGSRVFVRAGGIVEIVGFSTVRILSPNVVIQAPSGVAITGPVTITGAVTITGDTSITGSLHVTGDITGSNETLSGTLRAAAVNP